MASCLNSTEVLTSKSDFMNGLMVIQYGTNAEEHVENIYILHELKQF